MSPEFEVIDEQAWEALPKTRACRQCRVEKPLTAEFFYVSKKSQGGLNTKCKECIRERHRRKWYDPEAKAKQLQWRQENKERVADSKRRYVVKNPTKVRKSKQRWKEDNVEKCSEVARNRYNRSVQWLLDYKKTLRCFECGDQRWYVLEMHHIDPATKVCYVSTSAIMKYGREVVKAEIEKTVPLCANCHKELHYLVEELNKRLEEDSCGYK